MLSRKIVIPLVATGLVCVGAAPFYHRSCPPLSCGIPSRDYQYMEFSRPIRSLSARGILLPRAPDAPLDAGHEHQVRLFQFVKRPILVEEHCALSDMSVLLHETGGWSVSFRAHQNPAEGAIFIGEEYVTLEPFVLPNVEVVTTLEPRTRQTSHILRNQFYVQVTCYGDGGVAQDVLIGRPVVAVIELEPFWVQRRQPYPFFTTGNDPRIAANFDRIDRVEIEFKFRRN